MLSPDAVDSPKVRSLLLWPTRVSLLLVASPIIDPNGCIVWPRLFYNRGSVMAT